MAELTNIITENINEIKNGNLQHARFRDRSSVLYEKFKIPSGNIDNVVIQTLNSANSIKTNIVSIGGNVGLNSNCYLPTTNYVTATYGTMVVSTGVTYGYTLGINTLGPTGMGTNQVVGYGVIKFDKLEAYTYPKIENLDVSVSNPVEGEGYVTLNSGNSGSGRNTLYTVSGGTTTGYVFSISATSPCPASTIQNQVTNLIADYNETITNVEDDTGAANIVKTNKTEHQFHIWAYSRKIKENEDFIGIQSSVITTLNEPEYGGPY